jgi:hypothetical protein
MWSRFPSSGFSSRICRKIWGVQLRNLLTQMPTSVWPGPTVTEFVEFAGDAEGEFETAGLFFGAGLPTGGGCTTAFESGSGGVAGAAVAC